MREIEVAVARVKAEGEPGPSLVSVSCGKPPIPDDSLARWQRIVDLVAGMFRVPAGLVTRLTEDELHIAVASLTEGNPYAGGDKDRLGIGMFCETVAARRREVKVDDSSASEYWANNPHAGLGMKSYLGVPIEWEDGELFGTFCVLDDEPNRLKDEYLQVMLQFKEIIEADLRYALLKSELEERLSAKELELREIHHRLKNQLALLVSYISLQARSSEDEEIQGILKEVQHRVVAIEMIHESCYRNDAEGRLSLGRYLAGLGDFILADLAEGRVVADYDIEDLALPVEQEVPLGLILSELVTNSIKHAYPDEGRGRVGLRVRREGDGRLSLTYRDDGPGLPPGFDPESATSLGLTILRALSKQLGGSMRARSAEGAEFSFTFSI